MTYYVFDGFGFRRGVIDASTEDEAFNRVLDMGLDPNTSHVEAVLDDEGVVLPQAAE